MVFLDLDEWLSVCVPKYVVIKDRRLGMLKAVGVGLIVLYFVLGPTLSFLEYLALYELHGTVESKLSEPDSFRSVQNMSYCTQYAGNAGMDVAAWQLPCAQFPHEYIAQGTESGVQFVTLLFGVKRYSLHCFRQARSRAEVETACESTGDWSYVGNADAYQLKLSHTAFAATSQSSAPIAVRSIELPPGRIDMRRSAAGGWKSVRREARMPFFDVLPLEDVLAAAGAQLDLPTLVAGAPPTRYTGLELRLSVHYEHDFWGSVTGYTYVVDQLARAASLATIGGLPDGVVGGAVDVDKVVVKRRGLRITYAVHGFAGQPSLQAFLLALAASAVLLSAVNMAIDLMICYVMPHRDVYRIHQYDESVNFSDLRKGKDHAVEAVRRVEERFHEHRGTTSGDVISVVDVALASADTQASPDLKYNGGSGKYFDGVSTVASPSSSPPSGLSTPASSALQRKPSGGSANRGVTLEEGRSVAPVGGDVSARGVPTRSKYTEGGLASAAEFPNPPTLSPPWGDA
eukprot:TRINITY_DN3962_c0_g1_i1.p1 TRINITY_DN3962_c0_g1~~TRINITY_DN3962_c0_g1_i1.p1  ORF type:complete len:515 (+),score=116.74 TRINITY_DN3962_c0_g1_i1:418-1962(+)